MSELHRPRLLILETSGRAGQVGLASGAEVRGVRTLEASRRQARDLVPATAELLAEQGWRARDLDGVVVSRGPGSYTGLRVGLMSAKALAYATGCALVAVDTFAAIALQTPEEADRVDVLADAQQDKVYVQSFRREADSWRPAGPLAIRTFREWREGREAGTWVTGPGLLKWEVHLPEEVARVAAGQWEPRVGSLLKIGLARYQAGERDDLWTLEPLYLRPSSAEEQWQRRETRKEDGPEGGGT